MSVKHEWKKKGVILTVTIHKLTVSRDITILSSTYLILPVENFKTKL